MSCILYANTSTSWEIRTARTPIMWTQKIRLARSAASHLLQHIAIYNCTYGLIRSEVLRKTRLHRSFPDRGSSFVLVSSPRLGCLSNFRNRFCACVSMTAGRSLSIRMLKDLHARRTQLLYQKTLGQDVSIGIIAVPNPGYDARHWWRYSEGVEDVVKEGVAYLYARLFFFPPKPVHAEKPPQISQGASFGAASPTKAVRSSGR